MTAAVSKRELARERERRKAERFAERWRDDPVAFAHEALGLDLWSAQAAVARSVHAGPRTAWRAAQKVGKSELFAALALWWFYTRPEALVILSSGNASQVRLILWRALRRLHSRATIDFGAELHLDPATGLVHADGRLIVGLTASTPERFQGYSGAEILVLIDEASGFDDALLEAALGNLGGGGHALLAGNPTKPTGMFARAFKQQIAGWSLHATSALDSPNIAAGRVVVRGLATAEWARQMAEDFGSDSPAYRVRVLGEYADEGSDAVISLALVEAAVQGWQPTLALDAKEALEIGCDPARFGSDESVIQGRRGKVALPAAVHRQLDTFEVAARVLEYARTHGRIGERVVVRVDVGGLGAGVVDALSRLAGEDLVVEEVNSASASRHETRFKNTRSELWFCTRRWLERGGLLPPDQRRDAELLCAKYGHDSALRIQVASKDDMRKALRRSPDRADALALAVFSESPLEGGDRAPRPLEIVSGNPRETSKIWRFW